MHLLIQNGHLYTGDSLEKNDVLIKDGVVTAVGKGLMAQGAEVFDASGGVVSPGFTDLHVHLRQPGFAHKETIATGTAAGAAGGFTTLCAMPNVEPVPDDLHHLDAQRALIDAHAVVRVLPYGAISVGEKGACLADIPTLAPLVGGVSDDGHGVQDADLMRRAMEGAAKANSLVAAHCEVEELIAPDAVCIQQNSPMAAALNLRGVSCESEWAEVERDIRLCGETGCRLHICHTSAATSFALVRRAKREGVQVTCEVTPHNLLLGCADIHENDGRFKMNPPLREAADLRAALEAVLDGTVDAIATDHAPHTAADKEGGFLKAANGVVGLETAFPVLYTHLVAAGVMALGDLLRLFTFSPRRVLGLAPNAIRPGAGADLTVLDLGGEKTVDPARFLSKGRATPFGGWRLKGWPVLTVLENKIVYRAR